MTTETIDISKLKIAPNTKDWFSYDNFNFLRFRIAGRSFLVASMRDGATKKAAAAIQNTGWMLVYCVISARAARRKTRGKRAEREEDLVEALEQAILWSIWGGWK